MASPTRLADFARELYHIWVTERPNQLAAALAYYGMFSFAPVIYIAMTVAGIFIDQSSLIDRLFARLSEVLGPEIAGAIHDSVASLSVAQGGSTLTTIVSFLALLLAASGMFFQLQFALNAIWKVPPPARGGTRAMLRQRLFSFVMVLAVGLLLIVAVMINLITAWIRSWISLPGVEPLYGVGAFFGLATLAFILLYKVLPDAKVAWRDVWLGAALTAFLITFGGWLVLSYLGLSRLSSALEAAGAFAVLLISIYYIAQIFLFGAVFTRVYAHAYGSMRRPIDETEQGSS